MCSIYAGISSMFWKIFKLQFRDLFLSYMPGPFWGFFQYLYDWPCSSPEENTAHITVVVFGSVVNFGYFAIFHHVAQNLSEHSLTVNSMRLFTMCKTCIDQRSISEEQSMSSAQRTCTCIDYPYLIFLYGLLTYYRMVKWLYGMATPTIRYVTQQLTVLSSNVLSS